LSKQNSRKQDQIRERREKIRLLPSRGYSQGDIMRELGITTMTYNRDMKNINEESIKQFYDLAKSNPLTIYSDHVNDLDKIKRECWEIYRKEDNTQRLSC
jgi:hypothetical protein